MALYAASDSSWHDVDDEPPENDGGAADPPPAFLTNQNLAAMDSSSLFLA